MNTTLLIDAIVRQTTVLIAQLATISGGRTPVAHVANQVFLDLANELKAQGLGHKVIADMFGLALRTYHARVQRLSESATVRGRSLWEVVLEYVQQHGTVSRAEVLRRFRRDDDATVRGVLRDLVDNGLVFKSGRGDRTVYRAADPDQLGLDDDIDPDAGTASLVWVSIHRAGPITRDALAEMVRLDDERLDGALERLVADGRAREIVDDDGSPAWVSGECVIMYDDPHGWEAAVFDHYQAMVAAICTKLGMGATTALPSDAVGGSTYVFDIRAGNPLRDEIRAFLRETRERATELRARLDAENERLGESVAHAERVVFYAGQSVQTDDTDEDSA